MNTEVFNNIDTLINMAGSTLNLDEASSELISLKRQIKNKKSELEDLNNLVTEARYFNASNELVDKNIEISLKNKIARLNKKLKEIKASIVEISQNEKKLHEEITDLKNKIESDNKYISVLTKKVESSNNSEYYRNLLNKELENLNLLNEELVLKNNQYDSILKELELNNQALSELNNKLDNEKARLNDILENLSNPYAYIDEDLKASDQEKINTLKEELEHLEKRELELLTDAGIIGSEAKELIADNNIAEALAKIKELVTIVKAEPYMDINNPSILEEELEKKENLRLELSSLIDSKTYEGINSNAINTRLEYLSNTLENNNKKIASYQNEINTIDEFINNTLGKVITDLEAEVIACENTIKEYRELLKDNSKTLKTKTNLENAIIKKEKEKKVLDDLLKGYKEDLVAKINETNFITELIVKITKESEAYEAEQANLQKVSMLDFKTKDLIEEEKDKEDLRKLNEEIKQIKNRSKYEKTATEIYDQIEMLLAQVKPAPATPSLRTEKNKSLEIDNLFDSTPQKEEPTNDRIKVIEMIPVDTVKKSDGGN